MFLQRCGLLPDVNSHEDEAFEPEGDGTRGPGGQYLYGLAHLICVYEATAYKKFNNRLRVEIHAAATNT